MEKLQTIFMMGFKNGILRSSSPDQEVGNISTVGKIAGEYGKSFIFVENPKSVTMILPPGVYELDISNVEDWGVGAFAIKEGSQIDALDLKWKLRKAANSDLSKVDLSTVGFSVSNGIAEGEKKRMQFVVYEGVVQITLGSSGVGFSAEEFGKMRSMRIGDVPEAAQPSILLTSFIKLPSHPS